MTREEADAVRGEVVRFCNRLREMGVDAVQVLSSWGEDNSNITVSHVCGLGNWYSRVGLAKEFLDGDTAETNADRIVEKLHEDDNEGETWKDNE